MENSTLTPKKTPSRKLIVGLTLIGQVSVLLVAPVVIGAIAGVWLDNYFHSSPVIVTISIIVGFAVSMFNVFRVMKFFDKED